jgi:hypothetical protein
MHQTAGVKEVNWSKVAVAAFELVEKSVVGHRMSENRELQESAPNESAAVCNMGLKDE